MLERPFRLSENGTTAGREIQAGLTTIAAMTCEVSIVAWVLPAIYFAESTRSTLGW